MGDPDAVVAAALREARPAAGDLPAAVTRARVAAALFGADAPVTIGRYAIEARAGAGGGGVVFAAWDPELSRRVAIKLLHGGDRERLLAEGHALARLSHPNVVPAYDAGVVDDQVYVVMELVEGDTLRAFAIPPRGVREVVRAYRQAAEGLAAAHRAGVVHRDFKPDNAVVGSDGRVRVVDFGLAVTGEARGGGGTPRYMAPEQRAGEVVTPAADQYAVCVALREAVVACGGVPRWLEAILRRGSAPRPAARFASMAELADALGRDPAARWRRRAVGVGAIAVAAAAFLVGRGDRDALEPCTTGARELAAVWNPPVAGALAAHLAGLGTAYGERVRGRLAGSLATYADAWRSGHRAACLAHRDATLSTPMYDRRLACLAGARAALGTAIEVARTAPAAQLGNIVHAVDQLPALARCADSSALPAPLAAAGAQLTAELASLEVEVRAAVRDVRPQLATTLARARALGTPAVIARALRLVGFAAVAAEDRRAAIAPLAEATLVALTAQEPALAVEAYAARAYAEGTTGGTATALAGLDMIEAIAGGLPDAERVQRARLASAIGSVRLAASQRDLARTAFERAFSIARTLTGPDAIELAEAAFGLALVTEDPARQRALSATRTATLTAALGADHPFALRARLGDVLLGTDLARVRAALAPVCRDLVVLQPSFAPAIAECEYELAQLARDAGDLATTRAAFALAAATNSSPLEVAIAHAHLSALAGRPAEALAQLATALADVGPEARTRWWVAVRLGDAETARAWIALSTGDRAAARAALDRAAALYTSTGEMQRAPLCQRRLAQVAALRAR